MSPTSPPVCPDCGRQGRSLHADFCSTPNLQVVISFQLRPSVAAGTPAQQQDRLTQLILGGIAGEVVGLIDVGVIPDHAGRESSVIDGVGP